MDADEPSTFADLGLRPELLAALAEPRLRGADADPARGDPAAARRAATCSARPRPAPARRRPSRCRCCSGMAGRRPGAAAVGAGPRADPRAGHAGLRGDPPLRPRARRAGAADLRRPADRPPAARAASAASTSWSPRPAARSTTSAAARSRLDARRRSSCSTRPTRCSTWASPRTSRRSSTATPDDAADRAVLGHDAAAHRRHRPPPPARPGAHRDRPRAAAPPARPRRCARAPTSCRGRTSRRRSAACSTSRRPTAAIVFCRTRDEVDELTETLNGRGYRAEALHGGMSQEQRDRVMGRLRAGTADLLVATDVAARGLDIDQLTHVVNYDVPSAPGGLRAPHRPRRPGRPRGRGDHAGRAARAPAAQEHRAGDQADDRDREGADGRRPARPPAGADPRRAARERCSSDDLERVPGRGRDAHRRVRRDGGRARRGEAGPRGGRRPTADEEEIPEVAPGPGGTGAPATPDGSPGRAGRAAARSAAGPGRAATTRLFVGGRARPPGIRPQDLVGAIAGESRLSRPRHRRHRDRRPVLARRGARGRGRRGDRRRCGRPGSRARRCRCAATGAAHHADGGARRVRATGVQATRRAPEGGSRRTAGAFSARPPRIGRGKCSVSRRRCPSRSR